MIPKDYHSPDCAILVVLSPEMVFSAINVTTSSLLLLFASPFNNRPESLFELFN
jgi:hypothetical protein